MIIPSVIDKLFISKFLLTKSKKLNPNIIRLYSEKLRESAAWADFAPEALNERLYWIYHDLKTYPNVCGCGKHITTFNGFINGYNSEYCSDNACEFKETKRRRKIGESSSRDAVKRLKKRQQTNLERYGSTSAVQTDSVKGKIKETVQAKYGVACTLNLRQKPHGKISDETKQDILNRSGGVWPGTSPESIEKRKMTCIEKYGSVGGYFKRGDSNKSVITNRKNKKEQFEKLLEHSKKICHDEYLGIYTQYKFECTACSCIFKKTLCSLSHDILCPRCDKRKIRALEYTVEQLLISMNIEYIKNDRKTINGMELDFFCPEYNLAIEVNGLYWHSEKFRKDKNYHLRKTEKCLDHKITLLHFFEDEVKNKQEIIKSIIRAKIGESKTMYARNLSVIKNVDKVVVKNFLNENHLQGPGNFSESYSLVNRVGEIFQVMTIVSPRFEKHKNGVIEIHRSCSAKNITVVGGLSRLLKHLKRDYPTHKIISYVDRRIGTGHSLSKVGFSLESITPPGYYYVDGGVRRHRLNYTKSKLQKMTNKIGTEKQLAEHLGLYRIWDCGNLKFVF